MSGTQHVLRKVFSVDEYSYAHMHRIEIESSKNIHKSRNFLKVEFQTNELYVIVTIIIYGVWQQALIKKLLIASIELEAEVAYLVQQTNGN